VLATLIRLLGDFDLVDDAPLLNRRLGSVQPTRDAYLRALQLALQGADRQFLQMRLDELPTG
jgi:RNA polymerase sigma-70 factor (ECF subfamily)